MSKEKGCLGEIGNAATKVLAGIVIAFLVMYAMSCSRTDSKEEAESSARASIKPLEIVNSGYWVDDSGWANIAVLVKNPNHEWVAVVPMVEVVKIKEDGTRDQLSGLIHSYGIQPGETGAVCGRVLMRPSDDEGKVSKLEFRMDESGPKSWSPGEYRPGGADMDNVGWAEVTAVEMDEYTTEVIGTVENKGDMKLSPNIVNVVFWDGEGNIVGGAQGDKDKLEAGGHGTFDVVIHSQVPPFVSVEPYFEGIYMGDTRIIPLRHEVQVQKRGSLAGLNR